MTKRPQPILIVFDSTRFYPFQFFVGEILKTEGINAFEARDLSDVSAEFLHNFSTVILPSLPLSADQTSMFQNYVEKGGFLIGLRPDQKLAAVFGLTPVEGRLSEGWFRIETSQPPGLGLETETLKYHGVADQYRLVTATGIATLYQDALTSTQFPAVALNSFGAGQAAIFTFDLVESIVLMRQGNPEWAGYPNEHDGHGVLRPSQMFLDIESNSNWNQVTNGEELIYRNDIPQADEAMHLFANLLIIGNSATIPLPRLWHLPESANALLILSGDQHDERSGAPDSGEIVSLAEKYGGGWADYLWYPFGRVPPETVKKWIQKGHEIGIHFENKENGGAAATFAGMQRVIKEESDAFSTYYSDLDELKALRLKTTRTHRLVWVSRDEKGAKDQSAQARIYLQSGIEMDTSFVAFPNCWGYMTGSGLPMKFIDLRKDPRSVIYSSETPDSEQFNDDRDYELGTRFRSFIPGLVIAIRFWKSEHETGLHVGRLWSQEGQLLASVEFQNESASGWQEQLLSTPVLIEADTDYTVSVNTVNYFYAATTDGMSRPVVFGYLTGTAGVYGKPAHFPTEISVDGNNNYFRDVVFMTVDRIIPVYQQATQYEEDVQIYPFQYSVVWSLEEAASHYQQSLLDSLTKHHSPITHNWHPSNDEALLPRKEYLDLIENELHFAQACGIPMWTPRRWLDFWRRREHSSISELGYSENKLSFTITADYPNSVAKLSLLIPRQSGSNVIHKIQVETLEVPYKVQTLLGITYARFLLSKGTNRIEVFYGPARRITGTLSSHVKKLCANVSVVGGPEKLLLHTKIASDGTYGFEGLMDGTYTVSPSAENYSFDPVGRSVTIKGSDATDVNFKTTLLTMSLFTAESPAIEEFNDYKNYELGMRFRSDVLGQIIAIRFWKSPNDIGVHVGKLWSADGQILGLVRFEAESKSGWQEQRLPISIPIVADMYYIVSVNTGNQFYAAIVGGLNKPVINAHLQGDAGVFGTAGQFPTNVSEDGNNNYFRDVVLVVEAK